MKYVSAAAFFVFFLCVSCSQSISPADEREAEQTLRSLSMDCEQKVDWTLGRGENRLDENETQKDMPLAESDVLKKADVQLPFSDIDFFEPLFLASYASDTKVYPLLEGFSVLDTDGIPRAAYGVLIQFLKGCKNKTVELALFPDNSAAFLKTVTEYELNTLPEIDHWVIGKASQTDGGASYEIPVRLFCSDGFFDAIVYVAAVSTESKNAFKIEQVIFGEAPK